MYTTYYIKDLHSYFEAPGNMHNEWRSASISTTNAARLQKKLPPVLGHAIDDIGLIAQQPSLLPVL